MSNVVLLYFSFYHFRTYFFVVIVVIVGYLKFGYWWFELMIIHEC